MNHNRPVNLGEVRDAAHFHSGDVLVECEHGTVKLELSTSDNSAVDKVAETVAASGTGDVNARLDRIAERLDNLEGADDE